MSNASFQMNGVEVFSENAQVVSTGAGFPAGHVIQVECDTDDTAQNTTASFVDYLQINITPKKSGNLIFITATIATHHLSSGTVITAKLVRDSTNLNYEIADYYHPSGSGVPGNINFTFIDNPTIPSTPISINYKIQIKHETGSGKTNTDFNGSLNGVSSLVAMEIQQ
jgi:hypothetical protein